MGRRKATNDKEISVSVSPWTDKKDDSGEVDFSLMLLHIKESIYGEKPGGRMELVHTGKGDATEYVNSQETATIFIEDGKESRDGYGGFSYWFNIFITSRKYQNNLLTLEFVCIPSEDLILGKNFYTSPYSESYPSIWDAINASYPGVKDKRNETDIPDDITIYRDNETSYDFVKRLGYSWSSKGVFAFGWDGLLLKKIIGINSFGNSEEDLEKLEKVRGDQEDWSQVSFHRLKYNKSLNSEFFNTWKDPYKDVEDDSITDLSRSVTPDDWYKEVEPKNVTSSIQGRYYRIHGKEYEALEDNKEWNERFAETEGYSRIVIVGDDMPRKWKLGDIILYERNRNDDSSGGAEEGEGNVKPARFLVASNEVFFSQNGATKRGPHGKMFEWTTNLWSVDKEDYNKELEENKDNKDE